MSTLAVEPVNSPLAERGQGDDDRVGVLAVTRLYRARPGTPCHRRAAVDPVDLDRGRLADLDLGDLGTVERGLDLVGLGADDGDDLGARVGTDGVARR